MYTYLWSRVKEIVMYKYYWIRVMGLARHTNCRSRVAELVCIHTSRLGYWT